MTQAPQSSPPRYHLPIGFAGFCVLAVALAAPLAGQSGNRITAATDFVKEPGGTVLGRLAANAAVTFGTTRGAWREVTLEGWIAAASLRDDSRDGFDVSVASGQSALVRNAPDPNASIRATAVTGALFHRLTSRSGWVQVRRTAWVARSATEQAPPAVQAPPPSPPAGQATPPAVSADSNAAVPGQSVIGGSDFAARADGPPIGRLEATRTAEVIEQRDGWSRVRLDVWVRDAALGNAPAPDRISGAEIRANPDRFVGQTVEWSLQVLAVQQADELRPELPLGQPYVLARGPLPETGFVYLVVQGEQADAFRRLDPLAQVRVRAIIRAGKTRFLPTPVLDLVRRLD